MSADLDPFVGVWTLEADLPNAPPTDAQGTVTFEWLPGGQFLIERWEVPHPAAPDGIAIIGFDEGRGSLLQHYFDSRGVARVYEMGFVGSVWTLFRGAPDFSELSFWQRFHGTFSDDGTVIAGHWESSPDGVAWAFDFALTYTKRT